MGIVTNVLDSDIIVSKFELKSHYDVLLSDVYPKERYQPSYPPLTTG